MPDRDPSLSSHEAVNWYHVTPCATLTQYSTGGYIHVSVIKIGLFKTHCKGHRVLAAFGYKSFCALTLALAARLRAITDDMHSS